jgi:hypothetical protein
MRYDRVSMAFIVGDSLAQSRRRRMLAIPTSVPILWSIVLVSQVSHVSTSHFDTVLSIHCWICASQTPPSSQSPGVRRVSADVDPTRSYPQHVVVARWQLLSQESPTVKSPGTSSSQPNITDRSISSANKCPVLGM